MILMTVEILFPAQSTVLKSKMRTMTHCHVCSDDVELKSATRHLSSRLGPRQRRPAQYRHYLEGLNKQCMNSVSFEGDFRHFFCTFWQNQANCCPLVYSLYAKLSKASSGSASLFTGQTLEKYSSPHLTLSKDVRRKIYIQKINLSLQRAYCVVLIHSIPTLSAVHADSLEYLTRALSECEKYLIYVLYLIPTHKFTG